MCTANLQAMHAPKFLEYANIVSDYVTNGEICVGMEFNYKEAVIQAIKSYIISKSVDYNVSESESRTFYYKCKH